MQKVTRWTIGLDLGDRISRFCVLDAETGEVTQEGAVKTERCVLEQWLRERSERSTIVMEAGTHSPWASRLVEACGHESLVADPRELAFIFRSKKKTDRADAMKLAEVAGYRRALLRPLRHRDAHAQAQLSILRARDALVRSRSRLINTARGLVKCAGGRIALGVSAEAFPRKAAAAIPEELKPALDPLLASIAELTTRVRAFDQEIERICATRPETERLRQVAGVGALISLAYVLTLGDPLRFKDSRAVGAWVGLAPRTAASGEEDPELPITKAGDAFLRRLLLQAAHYVVSRNGPDCDLKRWALRRMTGGANAKKRAVVAVARKLAVLLHRLWVTGADYEPLRAAAKQEAVTTSA